MAVEPHWLAWPTDDVDSALVGGKAASLMVLHQAGIPVPPFVVVTTQARALGSSCLLAAQVGAAATEVASSDGMVAVRSSATAEDLGNASFAGQYHSELFVHAPDGVMDAVERVWNSLDSQAAVGYRHRLYEQTGLPASEAAMAVVVMRQVAAQRAGVVFTCDPTGHPEVLRVESVAGTADRLVAGVQTPEVWQVPRGVIPTGDPVVADVVGWGLRCEEVFGRPQDVEWVWDGEQVWVVQSRPITTASSATTEAVTTAGVAEMLPAPLSPLVWDTAVVAVDHAMTDLFHHLGVLPEMPIEGDGLIARVGEGAGLRRGVLSEVAKRLPSTTPAALEAQLTGRPTPDEMPVTTRGVPLLARLRHDVRVARIRARALVDADIVLQAVEHLVDGQGEALPDDAGALWQMRLRHQDLLMRIADTEVAVAALAVAAFDRLVRFLHPYVHDDATVMAADLLEGSVTSPAVTRWLEVAEGFRRHPVGRRALQCHDWLEARGILITAGEDGRHLLEQFEQSVRRAGSRSVPGGVTWAEEPERAWAAVTAAASMPARPTRERPDLSLTEVPSRLTETERWRRRRVLTGLVIDSQQVLLKRHVAEAGRLLQRREVLKSAMLTVGGDIRLLHRRLAECEVKTGWLTRADDLEAKSAWEIHAHLMAPEPSELPAGRVLSGWPASAGRYQGRARVVTSPDDTLEPGEVLVARTTDPSWSPLFMRAGALVVEQGGPLSHAAVIARELGLPAVVNVDGLTACVHSGMHVQVDGRLGEVVIAERDDADAASRH